MSIAKTFLDLADELGALAGLPPVRSLEVKDLDEGFDVSINGECSHCELDYDGKHEKSCQYRQELGADSQD